MSRIITLNREYGAGGHSIGMLLSEKLGIPFYDKDLVKMVAKERGYEISDIEDEEKMTKTESFINFISPTAYNDQKYVIHEYQKEIMVELAKKEPCIILGRCADVILPAYGIDVFSVFMYADPVFRVKHMMEWLKTDDPVKMSKEIKKTDNARKAYYSHYTGNNWDDVHNYNLALDTGLIGFEESAEIIKTAYLKAK